MAGDDPYDPLKDLGDIPEGAIRSLIPRANIRLQNPTGEDNPNPGGPSMAGAKAIGKALTKGRESGNFKLPREGRSTPKGDRLPAPAVHTQGDKALVEQIYKAAAETSAHEAYAQEPTEPVFGPADPKLTKQIVPQISKAHHIPPVDPNQEWPLNDRARPIWEHRDEIARILAQDLGKIEQPIPFYSTGSVITGLHDKAGLTMPQSQTFMRDWSGQGAATSPQTKTPQNLRNSSQLLYRRATGNPFTPERFDAEGNQPGYGMMRMHALLGDEFGRGVEDPWGNTKPYFFKEAWSGNMADVTADQHNILATLDAYDRMDPGGLPREWFMSDDAYQRYREEGGLRSVIGDEAIDPGLKGNVVPGSGGRKAQTEYPILAAPTYGAAKLTGQSPSEAQENLWFAKGGVTGLRSPPLTIPDLLNRQIEATARATGLHPEVILNLWGHRRIPLAENEPQNVPGETATG